MSYSSAAVPPKRTYDWLDSKPGSPTYSTPGTPTKKAKLGASQPSVVNRPNQNTTAAIVREIVKEARGHPVRPDKIAHDLVVHHHRRAEVTDELINMTMDAYSDIKMTSMGLLVWQPPHNLTDPDKLCDYLRRFSTEPGGVPISFIKSNYQPLSTNADSSFKHLLATMEAQGKILIMRNPGVKPGNDGGGGFRRRGGGVGGEGYDNSNANGNGGLLPPGAVPKEMGRNFTGSDKMKATMMFQGAKNWKGVFWDDVRERGEAPVGKMEDEYTQMWADVRIPAAADLDELLAKLGHTISPLEAAKKTAQRAPAKKKKVVRKRETNRFTNSHLLSLGIDLSKDYVPEE